MATPTTAARPARTTAKAAPAAPAPETVDVNTNQIDAAAARQAASDDLRDELLDMYPDGTSMSVEEFYKAAGLRGVSPQMLLNASGYPYITLAKGSANTSIYCSKGLSDQLAGEYDVEEQTTSQGKTIQVYAGLVVNREFLSPLSITYSTNAQNEMRLKLGRSGEGVEIVAIW